MKLDGIGIWESAEQFIDTDCTLKSVFMCGETAMVAVEHQELNICCCFRASMVRTPEQAAAEKRDEAINDLAADLGGHWSEEAVAPQRSLAAYLHDIGYRKTKGGAQ